MVYNMGKSKSSLDTRPRKHLGTKKRSLKNDRLVHGKALRLGGDNDGSVSFYCPMKSYFY